jgi:hypothetical protein
MRAVYSGFIHSFILKNPGKKTIAYPAHELTPLQNKTKRVDQRDLDLATAV